MKAKILLPLAACAAVLPLTAGAWEVRTCWLSGADLAWGSNSAQMRYSAVSFVPGSWRDGMDTVVDRWNDNPSNFNFTSLYNDASVSLNNGQSEVWFVGSSAYSPAVEFTEYSGLTFCTSPQIVESDVLFYNADQLTDGWEYTTSMLTTRLWRYGDPTGAGPTTERPFQTTAMHELGHSLGLGHENDEYNIMGTDWEHVTVNDDDVYAYAGEDAGDGAVELYGLASSGHEDLAVTHWKYKNASGEYSDHNRHKLRDNAGNVLPFVTYGEWRQYSASAGDTIKIELTYENNGRTSQSTDVGIYLSSNDFISTLDPRLGGFSPTMSRNSVYERETTVTIPASTAPGEYWIGAVVDENGTLSERVEINNATWIPIEIN